MSHHLIQNSPTQMRNLRPREIQWLVQTHMPSLMERRTWNPGFLAVRLCSFYTIMLGLWYTGSFSKRMVLEAA